jgi:ADP-heptose:LPS heptosyltransferase
MATITPITADVRQVSPLVPPHLLATADRILFIAHLALGDFTYLQACFRAFAKAYPHVRIHLFVDERRRMFEGPSSWPHLKNYVLYDWLATCPFFDKVYNETYSPATYERSVREAIAQDYPVVVSLAVLQRHRYASLARRISPRGFVVGQRKPVPFFDLPKLLRYRKLDAAIPAYTRDSAAGQHISDIYAGWFTQMFGFAIPPAARFPVLDIPARWTRYARERFAAWGFDVDGRRDRKVVFLNSYAKSVERTWPLARVADLVRAMRREPGWRDAGFIVNVVPERMAEAAALFAAQDLPGTVLFSAQDNFFELPAVLSVCDLTISVETAVMHLANAVRVPVIALMRRLTPEWAPIDKANSTVIEVDGELEDGVERIGVDEVIAVLRTHAARPVVAPTSEPVRTLRRVR